MKKIIFMIINMNLGGTEKALLNMINEVPANDYEITIIMLEKYGSLLENIPTYVKIKYVDEYLKIKPLLNNTPKEIIKKNIKNKEFIKAIQCGIYNIIAKIQGDRSIYYKYLMKKIVKLNEEYDIAIAYAGPMELITYYVLNKINAKEKYQWIHFDIRKIPFNKKFAEMYFSRFNKVVVVSEEGKNALVERCPKLKGRVKVRLNTIPIKQIIEQSKEGEGFNDGFKGIRILTVGRVSEEKGQDLAIKACKMLVDEGLNIKWYCVGTGPLVKEYNKLVKSLNLEDKFEFLGAKKNPYRYMKECDIYVQPSRHEGFCITLGEIKNFNKFIISTNFTGAKEQLKGIENSYIVEDEFGIFKSIKNELKKETMNGKSICDYSSL